MIKIIKRTALTLALMNALSTNTVFADNKIISQDLQQHSIAATNATDVDNTFKIQLINKLKKIDFFSASFTQQIVDEQGKELQRGSGNLFVNKPNLVHWQTLTPDETLIVSDGITLWVYDPFIEQATAYTLDNVIANTPILLLTSNDESLWDHFTVSQVNSETYLVHANEANSQVKTLELTFAKNSNELTGFTILDSTGQLSLISLNNVDYSNAPTSSLFKFTLPAGTYLDDQR